ncbi:MAG TPA: hypothetical protein VD908_15750 [Cytophagales bacterium]|nr:hypothetical protein [Cytophagales bacterium]
MIRIAVGITALMFCIGACKKDPPSGPTSVHGFVVSGVDGSRVPYADVWLVKSTGATALSDKVVGYKRANSEAYYNFDFNADAFDDYFVTVKATHYLDKDFSNFTFGKNNKLDLPLRPKGYVKLNFKDAPPSDYLNNVFVNCIPNVPSALSRDTVFYGFTHGNMNLRIICGFNPSTRDDTIVDTTVFVKALDTTELVILY